MSNPIFNAMNGGGDDNIIQRFMQFKKTFNGDPQQQVQQLLNSGRISQAQYDNAVKMAQQLQQMINGR